MAEKLRGEGCTLIIALTHMRIHHDLKLAEQVPGIDIVLGGHDHFYKLEAVEQKIKQDGWTQAKKEKMIPVVKSGSDFLDFSVINITFNIDKDEYNEESAEIMEGVDYKSKSNGAHIEVHAEDNEELGLLMHSDEGQMMIQVNRVRMKDQHF